MAPVRPRDPLVLAVDASGSIDEDEMRLQRQGYASAFVNDRIVKALRSGHHGAIAVMYLEWAAVGCERILVNWTRLSDLGSAQAFADTIMSAPPSIPCPGGNAIGDAIAFSAANMTSNEWQGERLVIDVSCDGPNHRRPWRFRHGGGERRDLRRRGAEQIGARDRRAGADALTLSAQP